MANDRYHNVFSITFLKGVACDILALDLTQSSIMILPVCDSVLLKNQKSLGASGIGLRTLSCLIWLLSGSTLSAQTVSTSLVFNNQNGSIPLATLLLGKDNYFYGTTNEGGTGSCANLSSNQIGCGTVFKWSATGTLTTLVNFNGTNGSHPAAELVQGQQYGYFFGTTAEGGTEGYGTVFKIAPNGVFTTLVNFTGTNGAKPSAGLVQDAYGSLYGTTYEGGDAGYGTVFKVTPSGSFTTLLSFTGLNGANPFSKLVLGADGNFYGTTFYGGSGICQDFGKADGCGTVFKVTPTGVLTTLVNFNNNNGSYPRSGFVLGADSNFYGTTFSGGSSSGNGTVFRMTASGTLTTLFKFNGSNGNNPTGMAVGSDGSYYGVTFSGGAFGLGLLFRMMTDGTVTSLVDFDGTNGAWPIGVTQGSNGTFYGTTVGGGTGNGVIFAVAGALTTTPTLQSIHPDRGATATAVTLTGTNLTSTSSVKFNGVVAPFTVNSDSQITATVPTGASTGIITITTPNGISNSANNFTVLPSAPLFTSFSPSSGAVGSLITLTGSNFTGATNVTLSDSDTAFTVLSDNQITSTVPAGGVTGKFKVTTPGGSVISPTEFTVVQAPTLTSVDPSSAPVGATIVLTGTNLASVTEVKFGRASATISKATSTTLKVIVPVGAALKFIQVTNPVGSALVFFAVALPPTFTSFSPSSGAVSSTVTLTGTNFKGTTRVTLAGQDTAFSVVSESQITVTVPVGAMTGKFNVFTPGGNIISSTAFKVSP